jgi:hypothetical protein
MDTNLDVTDELARVKAKTGPSMQRGLFSIRDLKVRGLG